VKPEQLAAAPQITDLYRNAEGGLKAVLSAMRFCLHDEVIATFLAKYDSIPVGDRPRLPWEAIALAAGLDVRTVSGAILNAIVQSCANTSKVLAFTAHPKVMRATIRYGQKPSGEKDRRALDLMVGALPSPKGPTFIGKAVFGGASGSADGQEPGSEEPIFDREGADLDRLFPSAAAMQDKLVPIRQRQLPG